MSSTCTCRSTWLFADEWVPYTCIYTCICLYIQMLAAASDANLIVVIHYISCQWTSWPVFIQACTAYMKTRWVWSGGTLLHYILYWNSAPAPFPLIVVLKVARAMVVWVSSLSHSLTCSNPGIHLPLSSTHSHAHTLSHLTDPHTIFLTSLHLCQSYILHGATLSQIHKFSILPLLSYPHTLIIILSHSHPHPLTSH